MYFNRGLINGREAIAFWPDKRAAGYQPDRHPAGLPDFVLPTQTRPADGMTVADVGGLTPLLRWEGSFSNVDAFLETTARCEAQGWCLALTLDTVFVRKDGTLCLIALPFEDESLEDESFDEEYEDEDFEDIEVIEGEEEIIEDSDWEVMDEEVYEIDDEEFSDEDYEAEIVEEEEPDLMMLDE